MLKFLQNYGRLLKGAFHPYISFVALKCTLYGTITTYWQGKSQYKHKSHKYPICKFLKLSHFRLVPLPLVSFVRHKFYSPVMSWLFITLINFRNAHKSYWYWLGTFSEKKNDIIWEFFPNVGPPPHPPLLGTPYPKKIFSVYFAF